MLTSDKITLNDKKDAIQARKRWFAFFHKSLSEVKPGLCVIVVGHTGPGVPLYRNSVHSLQKNETILWSSCPEVLSA